MNSAYKIKILTVLTAIATMAISGCKEEFTEDFDLAVDSNALVLGAEEGKIAIGCYCDGEWNASLSEEIEWGSIDCNSGKGTTFIHFTYQANSGLARAVDLNLYGNGKFVQRHGRHSIHRQTRT